MDAKKLEESIKELLLSLGEEGQISSTPKRVAKFFQQRCTGTIEEAKRALLPIFESAENDIVIIKDIDFYSLCEHHLLPFLGKVHVAYSPDGKKVLGIGKIAKAIDILSRRLQMQEEFTEDIANIIMDVLKPKGVLVIVEAQHLCMNIKREKKAKIITLKAFGELKREKDLILRILKHES